MKPNLGVQLNYSSPFARNLAGLYLLNEGAGIRANELSNNKFGTLTNFSFSSTSNWTGSQNGGAVSFDGTNDYITAGQTMQPTLSGFSVAMTVNIRSFASFPILAGKYNENVTTGWFFNLSNTGVVQSVIYGNNTGTIFIGRSAAATPLSLNKWYNIAMTWNGDTTSAGVKVYINGQRMDDTNLAGGVFVSPNLSTADFFIGGAFISSVTGAFYMTNGIIDNTRIYNRELTSSEVMQLNINPFEGLNKIT